MLRKISLPKPSLRIFNNALTLVILGIATYIIAVPFLPQVTWWLRNDAPVRLVPARSVSLDQASSSSPEDTSHMKEDSLIIPSLAMRERIHEGTVRELRSGIWRLPHTSTPDTGSNTVLVGHRFTYAGQAVFYHLDKMKVGDRIGVRWQGKLYEYKVFNIRVVSPDEVSIEENTKDSRLTLYTCTPLWSATHRLVVQATLVREGR